MNRPRTQAMGREAPQVNRLKVADLGGGQVQVVWQRDAEAERRSPGLPFANPLSAKDRQELRWYLEEYLQFPYGAERDKAARTERRMEEWGEALFAQVLPKLNSDPDPRGFYQEAVR